MPYDVIIGLEIHTALDTESKMFCSCAVAEAEPNTNVCPICLGHPGTLPTVNQEAVERTVLLGIALGSRINRHSKFDRKNYFYPDLPKGYQISQYDLPFCEGGKLEANGKKIALTRIHLEEDTGKLSHPPLSDYSLIDFNRSGLPLIEMVTEPVIPDAATAKAFCQRYQQVLRYLRVSGADIEKGEMRCEANISLQKKGAWKYKNGQIEAVGKNTLNPKVEVKNIGSFRSLERAINYEIKRQTELLDKGDKIHAETRGWNDAKNETVRQRVKETAADYRYFPEPDLPPVTITPAWLKTIKARLVELPWKTEERLRREYGLSEYDASVIAADKALVGFTEAVISELEAWVKASGDTWERQNLALSKLAANWITNELLKHLNEWKQDIRDLKITEENFAELMLLLKTGKINSSAGQKILETMMKAGGEPEEIMKRLGLKQIDDEAALRSVIKKIIEQKPDQAAQYRAGKTNVMQFFIGQAMAATKGAANPETVKAILEEELKA